MADNPSRTDNPPNLTNPPLIDNPPITPTAPAGNENVKAADVFNLPDEPAEQPVSHQGLGNMLVFPNDDVKNSLKK